MDLPECPATAIQIEPETSSDVLEQVEKYITDTFTDIKTVKDFCDRETEWTCQRRLEIKKMSAPKSCTDAFLLFVGGNKLKDKLKAVLKDTLEGLKDLYHFLGALERLAVTSLFVFMDTRFPLEGVNTEAVRSVISAARTVSPLLIHFKRDDGAFFSPELDNVDLLVYQLHKYICITKWLCKKMKSKKKLQDTGIPDDPSQFSLSTSRFTENVADHLSQLSRIRTDKSFQLTFLVNAQEFNTQEINVQEFNAQEFNAQEFIRIYNKYHPEMSESLLNLEENAAGLDRMKVGSSAFTIIGSLVGFIGGILSITGLAVFPAMDAPTLTWWGGVLGLLSGAISLLTRGTEFAFNKCCVKEANNNIHNFTKKMQKTVDCLEQAASGQRPAPHLDEGNMELGAIKAMNYCRTIIKGFDAITDGASVLEPLDFSKQTTFVLLAGNIPSILIDFVFVCEEFWSIAKRKKSAVSQFIRSRTALWHSEIEAMKRIYDSLCEGKETFQENMNVLERDIREF